MGNISITKLSDHVGADVIGVDLREPLSDVDFGIVLEAFHRHSVIRLRDTGADDAGIGPMHCLAVYNGELRR